MNVGSQGDQDASAPEAAPEHAGGGDPGEDVARDQSSTRLGCLELYVGLTRPTRGEDATDRRPTAASAPSFTVEADESQRVVVRWRCAHDASEPEQAKTSSHSRLMPVIDQTWRVSSAFSPWEPNIATFETLGLEAVEWLWDGLSAVVLGFGQCATASCRSDSFLVPLGRGGGVANAGDQCLMEFCLQELCRRASTGADPSRFGLGLSVWELRGPAAKDLLAERGEDASSELRFETVRFETASEAVSVLQACFGANVQTASRSHRFVRVVLFDTQRESLSALHFAHVAGGDGVDTDVAADRQALWRLLEAASTGSAVEPTKDCRLSDVLAPLIVGNCKPFLLCTIPETPLESGDVAEAHALLDIAERASLITTECTQVLGVTRDDFELAALDTVLNRIRGKVDASIPAVSQVAQASSQNIDILPVPSVCAMPLRDDEVVYDDAPSPRSAQRTVNGSALSGWVDAGTTRVGGPARSPFVVQPHQVLENGTTASLYSNEERNALQAASFSAASTVDAHIAQSACLEECRELAAACAALRSRNVAKAERRAKELQDVHAEVATMRQTLASFEDACEAPGFLKGFRDDVISLRSEVERLREENAALTGARGDEKRKLAQRSTLQSLQAEASKFQQSSADIEQGEKHAIRVHRCLEDVRVRLDAAKQRMAEADRELSVLQPAYKGLSLQIEQSENERRFVQGELDKLRRTSSTMRGEISQLREVRGAIETLPPPDAAILEGLAGHEDTGRNGIERFAALQWKLGAVAPQLLPLCARARSEMEDLTQCCRRLEERHRRLQQMIPCTDEVDASFSVGSAASTSGRPRARSTDTSTGRDGARARHSQPVITPRGPSPRRVSTACRDENIGPAHVVANGNVTAGGRMSCGSTSIPKGGGVPISNGASFTVTSREPSPPRKAHAPPRAMSSERVASASSVRSRAAAGEGYASAWARNRTHVQGDDANADARMAQRPIRPCFQDSPLHVSPGGGSCAQGVQSAALRAKSAERRPGWRSPRAR